MSDIRSLVENVPLFQQAGDAFVSDVVPLLEPQQFAAGETIIQHGDVGDAMYFLTGGQVEVVSQTGDALAVLDQGTHFGEVAILKDVPRTATVRAADDCEVYVLKRASVLELTEAHPKFAQQLEAAIANYDQA